MDLLSAISSAASSIAHAVSTMDSEFWAAIAGAVVGGIITGLLQMHASRQARQQREEERAEKRAAVARSVFLKMTKIHSNTKNLSDLLEGYASKAEKEKADLWQVVQGLADPPDYVHFSVDEMSLLISLKNDDLFNNMINTDDVHNSLVSLFITHRDSRSALTDQLPSQMEGSTGVAFLDNSTYLRLRPKMIEIEMLLNDMRQRAKTDSAEFLSILKILSDELNSKAGLSLKWEPKPTAT